MKKTVLFLILAMGIAIGMNAQSQKAVRSEISPDGSSKAENYAEIKFDNRRISSSLCSVFPFEMPLFMTSM